VWDDERPPERHNDLGDDIPTLQNHRSSVQRDRGELVGSEKRQRKLAAELIAELEAMNDAHRDA
jgi:hypothetical protein